MRYFMLSNSSGETLDITTQKLFFNEPEGLGFEEETSFRRVGEVWWLNTASYRQKPITGKLLFNDIGGLDPYTEFQKFVRFIEHTPLVLIYYPQGLTGKQYRKQVRVTKLEKSELNEYGVLEESIEFTPYTPWYEITYASNTAFISDFDGEWIWGDDDENPDVAWPPEPDGTIPTQFGATTSRWVDLQVNASEKSPSKFVIYGPVSNPVWTHYVDGAVVATGAFTENISIDAGEALVIDNTEGTGTIAVYDVGENDSLISYDRNLYQKRNFNTACFITLRPGNNRIALAATGEDSIKMCLEGHIYHAAV